MTPTSSNLSISGEIVDAKYTRSLRKGLLWSVEESRLLVKLRKEQNLAWLEVIKAVWSKIPWEEFRVYIGVLEHDA